MQEDRHTIGTANEKIVRPMFFGTSRPKVMLRRTQNPKLRCAIKEYELNRGTAAEAISLANLEAIYAGGPVSVD